ncbi:MAG: hypothetical protein PV358_06870 [Acidimicrobiales bacterium]|nr:hypothetical protein [Acidimicrobiales bacterium]
MLIVPSIGVAVVSAVYVVDGDRRAEAARERLEAAELAGAATDALVSEQASAGLEALGASEAVSVDDPVPHTDEAVAALLAAFDAWSDDTAAPYRPAVDGLAELAAIRAEVAAAPDGTLAGVAVDAAADPGRAYDPLIDAFHDAADVAALSIDDPDERRGAGLIALMPEQTQSGDRLQRTLLLLGTGASTADTPEEITMIAAQLARWEAGLAQIRAAEEPYAALVDEHLPADDVAALSSVVDGVLTADGFRPTELNPRMGGGLGVVARAVPEVPLLPVHWITAARRPLPVSADELEDTLTAAADASRSGGAWTFVSREIEETTSCRIVVEHGRCRPVGDDDPADVDVTMGPGGEGGFVRCLIDPARTPVGPSVAPLMATVLNWLDTRHDLGLGPLTPATPADTTTSSTS